MVHMIYLCVFSNIDLRSFERIPINLRLRVFNHRCRYFMFIGLNRLWKSLDLKKKIIINVIPLVLVTTFAIYFISQALSHNGKDLQIALEFMAKVEVAWPSSLIQDDATKAMLLKPELLGDYSEIKIETYDRSKILLDEVYQSTKDPRIIELIDRLKNLEENGIRPLDTKILETLFLDREKAIELYFDQMKPKQGEYQEIIKEIIEIGTRNVEQAEIDFVDKNNRTMIQFIGFFMTFAVVLGGALFMTGHKISVGLESSMDILHHHYSRFKTVSSSIRDAGQDMSDQADRNGKEAKEASLIIREVEESLSNTQSSVNTLTLASDELKQSSQSGQEMLTLLEESNSMLSANFQAFMGLSDRLKEIGKKVDKIDGIVFKTNLLSVNASIEASKAGEDGKGFSVVAKEVGVLANLTKEMSAGIQETLEEINSTTEVNLNNAKESLEGEKKVLNNLSDVFKGLFECSQNVVKDVEVLQQHSQSQGEKQSTMSQKISYITESINEINMMIAQYTRISEDVEESEVGLKSAENILKDQIFGSNSKSLSKTEAANELSSRERKEAA